MIFCNKISLQEGTISHFIINLTKFSLMNKIKTYLKTNFSRPQQLVLLIVVVISLLLNIYLLYEKQHKDSGNFMGQEKQNEYNVTTNEIQTPYGVRNEIYSKFEDGKWNTYSTTTPITEDEILEMRQEFIRRQNAMEEYFRRQEELMRDFWRMF